MPTIAQRALNGHSRVWNGGTPNVGSDFRILGELQVIQDGHPCDLGSLRQRGVLARLILRSGQLITTDHLLDELWPDDMPATARHTLHVYISRLRSSLGPDRDRLSSDSTGYRLLVDPDELDAARFERLATAGRKALADGDPETARSKLEAALEMWHGPVLVEFADEDFASTEATRLDQLRWTAIENRAQADLELGQHAELTEELRELTLEQPFREVLWELLMLALYRSGRQADALRVYADVRMRLADELGIEPGPGLLRMQERVLAQDPTLSPAASAESPRPEHNLPLQRTSFVGRVRDTAIATELLSTCRLLTLTGAPGSGKTRLAIRLAGDHADRYRDGVAFVALAPVTEPRRLESVIAGTLGVLESGDEPIADALIRHLRERQLLLVLDNFEHMLEAAPRIGALLDASPDITVLATSRAPLGIAGEQEFPVLPLQVPPVDAPADPSSLRSYDAMALFLSRVKAFDPTFELDDGNAATIAAITARLDGLPLALELGASRLRLLTPQDLLGRMEHRLPDLASGSSDAIDRHRTLRGAISWSYELLKPSEQTVFRRLGVFIGAFTAEAAAAVTGVTLDAAWEAIESLLAKNLLVRPVDVGEARFAMLETLREFAIEMLDTAGEHSRVAERHARHFAVVAGLLELTDDAQDRVMERLSLEIDDVRAALRYFEQAVDPEPGLLLASSIWRYWQRSGQMAEGREWLERLVRGAPAADEVHAKAYVALAGLAYWQADLDAAWSSYSEALKIYRSLEDLAGEASVLLGMSMTATWRGDPGAGGSLAAEAETLFDREGDRAKVGEALMAEGFALWQKRDYAAARPKWQAALDISHELGDETQAVTQLAGMAGIEFHDGRRAEALRIALEALVRARSLHNVALCAWLLDFVAAFVAADDPETAVHIAGAADASRSAAGGGMRIEDLHIESARVVASRSMSSGRLDEAWAAGRAMPLEQAIDAALELDGIDCSRSSPEPVSAQ